LFLDRLDTLKTIARDAYPIVVNLARGIGPVLGQVLRAAGDLITQHVLPAMLKISQFIQQQVIPRVADLVSFAVQHLIPVFHQIGDVIAQKVAPMIGRLVDLFVQKVLPALQPLIKDGFELLKDAIAKLTPIAQDLIRWFSESALPVIESIAKILIGKLIPFVLQVADVLIKVLRPAFDIAVVILRDVVIPAFKAGAGIFLTLEDAGAHMAGAITDAIHGIAKVISWLWDNVVSPQFKLIGDGVHTLSTIFHDVFDGMGKIISAGFTDAVALVKAPINGIIGLINGAIRALNSISVDIPDWVPGVGGESFGIHLSEISTLATGGLVLPTPGGSVVRVAEAGQAEIVSPIPTMEAAMSRVLARAKVGRDAPLIGTVNVPGSLSAQGVAEYLYAKIGARGLATA
jgi:phage-related protein